MTFLPTDRAISLVPLLLAPMDMVLLNSGCENFDNETSNIIQFNVHISIRFIEL